MKKLLLTLCALFVLTHNQPAYANEVIITNEDVLVDSETVKDIDISTDKCSTFLVEVPILSKVSNTFDWKAYAYGDMYWETSVRVYGDLISNEQLRISFDEDIIMSPDGGLKESITWTGCMDAKSLFKDTYDATELSDNQTWDSVTCRIKPNPDTTAGLWRGYIKVNVFLEPKEYILTAEQFKLYVEDDNTVSSVTIPEYVNIDGVEHRVAGLVGECFYDFNNLRDIYLPDVPRFKISKAFANTGNSNYAGDITIHGSGELYLGGYSDMNVSIKVDGCTLFLSQNPFNGYNGSPPSVEGTYNYYHYGEVNQYDFSSIIGGDYILGQWGDVTLNPEFQTLYSSGFNNCIIDKLTVPMLKYADGSWWFTFYGCEVREVVMDNSFIGDNWFENCTVLKKVTLTDNVKYICQNAFAGCTSLDEVIIPESVEHIDPTAFTNTPFLENLKKGVEKVYINGIFICYGDKYVQGSYLEFPADLDILSVDTVFPTVTHLAFEETDKPFSFAGNPSFNKVTTLDLTNRRLNGYSSYVYFPNVTKLIVGGKTTSFPDYVNKNTLKEIEFTEGFESIGHYCFNHITGYEGSSFYIPASVFQIGGYSTAKQYPYGGNYGDRYGSGWGNHVFYNFGKDGVFKSFDVEDSSIYYTDVDGILYTKDLQALVAVPRAYEFENGVFELPNETRRLGELSFSRNPHVRELVISDNLEIFNNEDELEDYYNSIYCDNISVLNKGNSLSIATYQFTNIQKFTTRPTNPNYTSVDGILYTKDLKELVAIPNHYQGSIIIPEGCEKIRENAFWLDYESGGVHDGVTSIVIPTSMKDIDTKQLDYINRRWANNTTVKIGTNNYVKYAGRIVKASTIENRVAWDGGTGTYWFNSYAGNIGSDPSAAWARYNPIYIPEGIYSFEVTDTTYGVPYYHIIFGAANGSVTSLNQPDNSLRYTTEKGYFASEKGGCFAFISMCYVDNATDKKSVGDMNSDMATALLNSLKIEKVSDLPITPRIGYSSSAGAITRTGNDARASLRNIYEVNPDSTYKVRLSSDAGNYMFGAFAVVDINKVTVDSGWLATDVDYVLSGCEGITFNFKKSDNTAMTYEDAINISKYFTIEELSDHTHNYNLVHVDADCIYDGYDEYSCECTHSYKEIIPATGHSLVENVCSVCGGYGVITEEVASGCYDEYNKINKTWDELVSSGLVTVNGTTLTKVSTSLKGTLVVDNSITQIANNAMTNCTQLTKVIILNDDATLGIYVFSKCSNLKEVILPDNLVRIPNNTFEDCMLLEVADIPESVTEIGPKAFWHCDALKEVELSNNITSVGREAFCFCRSVETLTIPATLTTFDYREFCWMNNLSTVYLMHEEVPEFGSQLFAKWGGVKTTFYFKNQAMYDAFTTTSYIDNYTIKSDNFDW